MESIKFLLRITQYEKEISLLLINSKQNKNRKIEIINKRIDENELNENKSRMNQLEKEINHNEKIYQKK
jgi:hypothetical protein